MSNREEWVNNKKKNYENHIGGIISEILKPVLKGKNSLEVIFLTSWNKIFSEDIVKKTKFLKVSSNKNTKAILQVEVPASAILEMTHMKDIMLENIHTYFGYKAIDDIVFRRKA